MSDKEQYGGDKEAWEGEKEQASDDVEGHGFTPPAHATDEGETEEPDVEGHGFTPPAAPPAQYDT
jgi:hypothetical protein